VALGAGVQSVEEELDDARLGRPVAKRVPGRKNEEKVERNGVRKRRQCIVWEEREKRARERVRRGGERKRKRCGVKKREKNV
jgi:hypothetical protein